MTSAPPDRLRVVPLRHPSRWVAVVIIGVLVAMFNLFKSTSVVYVMAIGELFYQVRIIYNRNGAVWALLMVATVWYLVLTTILSIAQYYVERHFARGASRQLPPTPLQRHVNAKRVSECLGFATRTKLAFVAVRTPNANADATMRAP